MHTQQPADVLAKTVGKPLKFHIGNREATYFTKSTEYGKLLDNNHNDYLFQDRIKQAMAADCVQHFNIGTPDNGSDTFYDAVEVPETVRENLDAAQEEIERLQMEREEQRRQSLEKVAAQIGTMAGSSGNVDRNIREQAQAVVAAQIGAIVGSSGEIVRTIGPPQKKNKLHK